MRSGATLPYGRAPSGSVPEFMSSRFSHPSAAPEGGKAAVDRPIAPHKVCGMTRIEALTREAAALPKTERLELVRALLELDGGAVADAEKTWDEEIRARVQAVDEGRTSSVSLDDLRREMGGRLGA